MWFEMLTTVKFTLFREILLPDFLIYDLILNSFIHRMENLDRYLIEKCGIRTIHEMANDSGLSIKDLIKRCKALSLVPRQQRKQELYLLKNRNKLPIAKLADETGWSISAIERLFEDSDTPWETSKSSDYKRRFKRIDPVKLEQALSEMKGGPMLTVENIASLFYMTSKTFRRHFKEQYGTAPEAFFIKVKMVYAAELLEKSSSTVSDIAMDVGYENISQFIAMFRRHFNQTPKEYRKQITGIGSS